MAQRGRIADMREQLHTGRLDFDSALLRGVDMARMEDQVRRKVRCYRFDRGYQRNPRHSGGWASSHGTRVKEEQLRLAYMRELRKSLRSGTSQTSGV
jgi:hypothetical protein